jgi:hypothetical protein
VNIKASGLLAHFMNWSKNLYVFMLGALIVFSGCFGTGTTDGEGDADTGTTVINNYYNNTTNVIENTPGIFTSTTNGTTYGASVIINQSAGEAIHMLGVTGNTGGDSTGDSWDRYFVIRTVCGDIHSIHGSIDSNYGGYDHWLGGGGLECTHEITTYGGNSASDWRITSVVYQRVPVMIE